MTDNDPNQFKEMQLADVRSASDKEIDGQPRRRSRRGPRSAAGSDKDVKDLVGSPGYLNEGEESSALF